MICTTYFLTFFSELIPPTGLILLNMISFKECAKQFFETYVVIIHELYLFF